MTQTQAEHLDARNWTKDKLVRHLHQHDNGIYYTSAMTKAEFMEWHQELHEQERANDAHYNAFCPGGSA